MKQRELKPFTNPREGRGYLSPTEGYVHGRENYSQDARLGRDLHNPSHRVERRRIRGVRTRWFSSGMTLGIIIGIGLTLFASALVVTQLPGMSQIYYGQPDVTIAIGEAYLNRQAKREIGDAYETGVPALTLTGVQMDLAFGNRMDLQPTFNVDTGFGSFQLNPIVKNQLSIQNGELALNMVGDLQLGNLNLALEFLPFNLKDEITRAIDRVNNEVLISQINRSLVSGFGDEKFEVEAVTTDNSSMTIRLRER